MAVSKGQTGPDAWMSLLAHAGIHAVGTLAIVLYFAPQMWWLALVDLVVHAAIDRGKALYARGRQWTSRDRAFWVAFGIDQEAHNYTHLAFIIVLYWAASGAPV